MPELSGKVILVTGAGRGAGKAIALRLATAGAAVSLLGRTAPTLQAVADQITGAGGRAIIGVADVADEQAVQKAVSQTIEAFGGLDALINNAGISINGPVEGYALADWQRVLDTNLTGVFLCSRAVIAALKQRGGGNIIAIASGAARQGYPNMASYSASKFGLIGLMQALAAELGGDKIKASTILPGSIITEFGARSVAQKRASGNKYLEADDVAAAVLYLLTQPTQAWTQEMNLWPF